MREVNQFSGRKSPGFRFRFHVRSISHIALFLPLEMKVLPQIQRLLKGVSPLIVFNTSSLIEARKAFCKLRYAYDFAFWAAREYYVPDFDDPKQIVPLILNYFQRQIISTFLKRYFKKEIARYVISKDFGPCGVTTCVQAYILWSQIYRNHNNSNTCTHSYQSGCLLKENLLRFVDRDVIPPEKKEIIQKGNCQASFYYYSKPDDMSGIDFAYVHMADFSKFRDYVRSDSLRAYFAAVSRVPRDFSTLIVLEGNVPKPDVFDIPENYFLECTSSLPLEDYPRICENPFFLRQVVDAANPDYPHSFSHIDLSSPGRSHSLTL